MTLNISCIICSIHIGVDNLSTYTNYLNLQNFIIYKLKRHLSDMTDDYFANLYSKISGHECGIPCLASSQMTNSI